MSCSALATPPVWVVIFITSLPMTALADNSEADKDALRRAIACINRSREYADKADYDAAIREQQEALNIRTSIRGHWHAHTIRCYRNLGWLYLQKKDFQSAVDTYRKCSAIKPAGPVALALHRTILSDLAWVLHSCGHHAEALDIYEQLLAGMKRDDEEYKTLIVDATKLLDDMQIDGALTLDMRARCDEVLKVARQWAASNNQPQLMFEMMGRQAQLLEYFGLYSVADKLLQQEILAALKVKSYSIEQYSALWLQQAHIALMLHGYPKALISMNSLSAHFPSGVESVPFQSLQLQMHLAQHDYQKLAAAVDGYYSTLQTGSYATGYWLLVPQTHLVLHQFDKGIDACTKMLDQQLSTIERTRTLLVLVDIHLAALNWREAQEQLANVVESWGGKDELPLIYLVELEERQSRLCFEEGKFEGARKVLQGTVERCQSKDLQQDASLVRALANLAECERELGHFTAADEYFHEAEKLVVSEFGESHPLIRDVRRGLARSQVSEGKYAEAEPFFKSEIDYYSARGNQIETAHAQLALAQLCVHMGDYEVARTNWMTATNTIKKAGGGKGSDFARACLTAALLEYAMGNYTDSVRGLQAAWRAQKQLQTNNSWLREEITLALGNTYAKQLRLVDAQEQYLAVLKDIPAASPLSRAARRLRAEALLGYCGILRKQNSEAQQAVGFAKEAVDLYRRSLNAEHPVMATAFEELGACYQVSGDYVHAAEAFEECQTIRVESHGESHPSVLRILNNLAAVTLAKCLEVEGEKERQKLWQEAERLLTDGLEKCERHHGDALQDIPVVCKAHANLALLHALQGHTSKALAEYQRSLHGYLSYIRRNLIGLDEAEQLAFLHGELQPVLHAAYSFALENRKDGDVCQAAAEWAANFKGLSQEITAATHFIIKTDSKAVGELAKIMNNIGRAHVQIACGDLPSDTPILNQLNDLRSELIKKINTGDSDSSAWEQYEAMSQQWIDSFELRRHLARDEVLIDYFTFWYFGPQSHRWTMRAAAVVVPPENDSTARIRLVDLGDVDELIETLKNTRHSLVEMQNPESAAYKEWDNADPNSPDGQPQIIAKLQGDLRQTYNIILQFGEQELAKRSKIFICPDDDLWFVPWSCLPSNNGFLIESHSVTLLASSRNLVLHSESGSPEQTAAIYADPDYSLAKIEQVAPATTAVVYSTTANGKSDGRTRSGKSSNAVVETVESTGIGNNILAEPGPLDSLPIFEPASGTRQLESIKAHFESELHLTAALELGSEATERSFKSIKRPKFIVLGTHGIYEPVAQALPTSNATSPWGIAFETISERFESPLVRCGLALAGVNRRDHTMADTDDGYLTGMEICTTDLRGTELVFLTACETGLGDKRTGEAVAGLYQSFQLAGAKNVVGTLWQVDGEAASLLTEEFWKNVAAGKDYATALRLAQLAFLKDAGYRHPYYWAAFSLVQHD